MDPKIAIFNADKMNEKTQLRKRTLVRIISFVDIAFGVSTIGLYLYILLVQHEYLDLAVDVDISAYGSCSWLIETLNLVFLVSFNCVQVIFASILFANLIQTRPDFLQSLQKSWNWLQITKVFYILLSAKIILIVLYSFIPPKNDKVFTVLLLKTIASDSNDDDGRLVLRFVCKIVAVVEWAFKPVAIYTVELFVQDLVDLRYSQMWISLSGRGTQGNDLNPIGANLEDELKSNLFWINYKNEDIKGNFTSCTYGNPRTSQMATGSCSDPKQMVRKSLSEHFCMISSPAVTVDGPSTSSSVPTSHHI